MSKIPTKANKNSCLYFFRRWLWYGYVLLLQLPSINGAYGNVVSLPGECRDMNGKKVEQDAHYVPPGSDTCRLCLCDNGHPKACKAVLCSPPHDCKSFQIGSSCCEFICLDDTIGNTADKTYDVGIRLRHRKTRAQEGREVIDDPNQRNLVNNVGYMGGSIGYLGGGTMNMDYSYVDHAVAPHYQLWKPPGAYYTRGEAPPPYEEAIAIAHAESLSSCTVSVATSTGRNFPLGVVQDSDAVPNITANTTNLISININGTGGATNITEIGSADSSMGGRSVATITNDEPTFVSSSTRVSGMNGRAIVLNGGDRHNGEANNDTAMAVYNHHSSNILHQTDTIQANDGNLCENVNLSGNHHCAGGNTIAFSGVGSDLCMNSSCELNINAHQCNFTHHQVAVAAVNVSSGELGESGVHRAATKEDHCSSMFHNPPKRLSDGADKFVDASHHRHCQQTSSGNCADENSQLPTSSQSPISQSLMQSVPVPAMFNDDIMSDSKFSNYSDKSTDVIKNRITGKKYHRTIPRHFSVVDPIINPIKSNFIATATATTASTPAESSTTFTAMQQERLPGDSRDKQCSQRTLAPGPGSVTPGPNIILTNASGNAPTGNRKICQCPIQHKALSGYQSTASGRSSGPSSFPGDDSYRSLRTSADILHNRADSSSKQTPGHGDSLLIVASKRSNAMGTMRDSYGTERTPIKRANDMGLMNHRYHEKEHRKMTSSFADGTTGTGGNRVKTKQQNNYQHRPHSEHSSHIGASERKVITQLPLDELMSARLTNRPGGIENEERSHTLLKKSALNMTMDNDATSSVHNPTLPPKAKKQQQQHQHPHQHQAVNKTIAAAATTNHQQLRDVSLGHQKISSLPEKANDANNCGGKQLRELRKSPIHVNHDTGGVLKVCNNNGLSSGFSNSLPRHSFTAARNFERKQRNDSLMSYNLSKGSKANRSDVMDNGLMQDKVLYDSSTLPKNLPNNNGRKTSLVTEAVNHIPPIINIPVTSHSAMAFGRNSKSNNQSSNTINRSGSLNATAAESSNHPAAATQGAIEVTVMPANTNPAGNGNSDDGGTNSNTTRQPILLPLPVLMTTITNCANPREHILPNDNSLDEDYLSECENCKSSANNIRYYLDLEEGSKTCAPIQETMTLQRKMPDAAEEEQQNYYRVSSTLPTNTSKRNVPVVNKDRVAWFSTIPASSSSEDEEACE